MLSRISSATPISTSLERSASSSSWSGLEIVLFDDELPFDERLRLPAEAGRAVGVVFVRVVVLDWLVRLGGVGRIRLTDCGVDSVGLAGRIGLEAWGVCLSSVGVRLEDGTGLGVGCGTLTCWGVRGRRCPVSEPVSSAGSSSSGTSVSPSLFPSSSSSSTSSRLSSSTSSRLSSSTSSTFSSAASSASLRKLPSFSFRLSNMGSPYSSRPCS